MVVSFKVSKVGRRYRPDILQVECEDNGNSTSAEPQIEENEADDIREELNATDHSNVFTEHRVVPPVSEDIEVSFSVSLFTNGFSIGKATEPLHKAPKLLQPYDKASEQIFAALETGFLPGDVFDDIPCKYVNGAILCEIRDYRNCLTDIANVPASEYNCPIIHKVRLQIGTEKVVKDIASISDDSWTYEDLLKLESGILKALQPNLQLNPNAVVHSASEKLDLNIQWIWKKRKLNDLSTTDVASSGSLDGAHAPGIDLGRIFKSRIIPSTFRDSPELVSAPKQWYTGSAETSTHDSSTKLKGKLLDFSRPQPLPAWSKLAQQRLEAALYPPERLNNNMNQSFIFDDPHLNNFLLRDVQSNHLSSPPSRVTVLPGLIQGNQGDCDMISTTVCQKRKASENHQVFTGGERSSLGGSFFNEVSQPAAKKLTMCSDGLNLNAEGSRSTNDMIEVDEPSLLEEDSCLPVLERFSKIHMVTHRKHLSNNFTGRRPYSCGSPLAGINLVNLQNNETLHNDISDQNHGFTRTRALTFIRLPSINQGNTNIVIDNGDKRKLVIKGLDVGIIKAIVFYGHEEEVYSTICFPFPLTIPNAQYADLFAAEFTSLMEREGFTLSSNQVESTPRTDDSSSSQSMMPLPSLPMSSPMSTNILAHNLWQSLSQNFMLRNSQSAALNLANGQPSSSLQEHWAHIYNNRFLLQSQMQQRHGVANIGFGSFNEAMARVCRSYNHGNSIPIFNGIRQPFSCFSSELTNVVEQQMRRPSTQVRSLQSSQQQQPQPNIQQQGTGNAVSQQQIPGAESDDLSSSQTHNSSNVGHIG